MSGFDELIEHLLSKIALSGSDGFSAHQYETTVRNYYEAKNEAANSNDDPDEADLLFSNAPPVKRTTVDAQLLDSIFDWLCSLDDVEIKDVEGQQPQTRWESSSPSLNSRLAGKRISTSEDRVWQAIAGHGVDHRRVPPLEFAILSVVAARGPAGILQPHVTKITGQDKRSVPKRTDALAEKGYIIKEHVLGAGARTSSLKLKRYANEQAVPSTKLAGYQPDGSSEGTTRVVYYNVWFNMTIKLLQENENIITMDDLRQQLGVSSMQWETKFLRRCIRNLCETGCIRCVSARVEDPDGNAILQPASGEERQVESIQLLREPTDFDRIKWGDSDRRDEKVIEDSDEEQDVSAGAAAVVENEAYPMEVEEGVDDLDLLKPRAPPQWTPDRPIVTQVYELVEESGTRGISTMDLANRLTGPAWRRPLDQVLLLLSDTWRRSQPAHLRHLSILRESVSQGRLSYFKFRTYDNFQKAVNAGTASWESVLGSKDAKSNGKAAEARQALDEWGFPLVPMRDLVGHSGKPTSSLEGTAPGPSKRASKSRKSLQEDFNSPSEADNDGFQSDAEGQLEREVPSKRVAHAKAQTSGVKRRRSRKITRDPSTPDVPSAKKREIPQHELDEWEVIAEMTAQRKVLLEVAADRRRTAEEAGDDETQVQPVTIDELPEERVKQLKEQILARQNPGIYINPPGARSMKREGFVARGRPRKALIAVVKTDDLNGLNWFKYDGGARYAPMASRRRTARVGVMTAQPKSPEFVDSDSEQDEPMPKKQRLNTSRPGHDDPDATTASTTLTSTVFQSGHQASSPAVRPTSTENANDAFGSTAAYALAVTFPPQKQLDTLASSLSSADRSTDVAALSSTSQRVGSTTAESAAAMQAREQIQRVGDNSSISQSGRTMDKVAVIAPSDPTQAVSAAEQLKALKSRRGRRSKETLARISELEKQMLENSEDAANIGSSVGPDRNKKAPASQTNMSLERADKPDTSKSRPNRILQGPTTEATVPIPERLQKSVVKSANSAAGVQVTPKILSNAVDELKALKSRPGRETQVNLARIAELEGQIREAQNTTLKSTRGAVDAETGSSAKGPDSEATSFPASKHSANAAFSAASGRLLEIFDKAYVLAHPDETFHHRGNGRYARGPRPSKATSAGQSAGIPPRTAVVSEEDSTSTAVLTAGVTGDGLAGDDVRATVAPIADSAAYPSGEDNALGIDAATAVSDVPRAEDAAPSSTAKDDIDRVGGVSPEENGVQTKDATTAGDLPLSLEDQRSPSAGTHGERQGPSRRLPELANHPEKVQGTTQPNAQDVSSGVYDAKYVDEHPHETFYHRGRGKWMPGLPPPGSTARVAVRGPGAEAWKSSASTAGNPPNPSLSESKASGSVTTLRKTQRRKTIANTGTASSLVVRLRVPRPYLATLASSGNDLSVDLSPAVENASPQQEDSLPTPPQDADLVSRKNNKPLDLSHASSQTDPGSSTARALSSLLIIRPYSSPQSPDPSAAREGGLTALIHADGADQPQSALPQVQHQSHFEDHSMDVDEPMLDDPTFGIASAAPLQAGRRPPTTAKRGATGRPPGSIVARRQKTIMDAVHACDGVFPGNGEMWFVVTKAWKRMYDQTPNKVTIEKAVKYLLQSQKLKQLYFQFHDKKGQVVERAIIAEVDVDPNAAVVKKMKRKIMDCCPGHYVPPEVEVDEEIRAKVDNNLAKHESDQLDEQDAELTAPHTSSRELAIVEDESVSARQTQAASAIEADQAGQQGFSDALAYLQHLQDETLAKTFAANTKRNAKPRDMRAWGDEDYHDEIGNASVRRLPPELPGPFHRKPLSSLRPRPPTRKNPRRSRDVERGLTLEDEARFRLRAGSLTHHPRQTFHEPSGTFTTSAIVPVEVTAELRTLRNRAVVLNGYEIHSLVRASTNVPHDLINVLGNMHNAEHQIDKVQQFYQEVDAVQAWEDQLENSQEPAHNGPVFINHILNQPHIYAEPERDLQTSTVPAQNAADPSFAHVRPLGAQSLMTPAMSTITGRPKRQYTSRKRKAVNFEDDAQDSDPEYLPDAPSPGKPSARFGRDGRQIVARDRRSSAEFKDAKRLVTAVALVTALCGGVNMHQLPWNIVAHAMSFRFDGQFYRRRWDAFKRYRAAEVDGLRNRIRQAFLAAYERDEVPPVDFHNPSKTDWPAILTWVEEKVLPGVAHSSRPEIPDLLHSRVAVQQHFSVEEKMPLFRFNPEEFFTNTTDMGRKHYALRYMHGIPLQSPRENNSDDLAVLKSWARAVTVTKQWNYDANAAASKLRESFPARTLEKATAEMVESRILVQERKGRHLPGRNFMIHGDVLAQFRRWPSKPEEHQYLRQVATAWANINQHLQAHGQLDLIAEAADPEYLVLTNMVAQGLVKVTAMLPPRKDEFDAPFPKLSPWGYAGPTYETKKVNPHSLKAPIVYRKTSIYQSRHGLKAGVPIPLQLALRPGEKSARIPFWVDIHGNLVDDIWDMVVRSLTNLIVFRPGSTASRMEESHSNKFGDWEIEPALDWMEKVGIAARCGDGHEVDGAWKGGWRAGEWWYCAFAPDIATWNSPTGDEIGDQTAA